MSGIVHICEGCEEKKKLLAQILDWLDSDTYSGMATMAWVHGWRCSEEFSKKAHAMFNRARRMVGRKELPWG